MNELHSSGQSTVTPAEATALADSIGASAFIECSAMTQVGVRRVFEEAIR